jgi:PAS domain-containing protein
MNASVLVPILHDLWGSLLEDAGQMAAVISPDGLVLTANGPLACASGCPEATLVGRDWIRECVVVDVASAAFAHWQEGAALTWPIEACLRRSDGSTGPLVRWFGKIVEDTEGRPAALALIGSDASAERAKEGKLLRAARFHRALSDLNKAIVRLADTQALHEAVCRIAIDSLQASMAWIGMVEDGRILPVAWSGAARAYTSGLHLDADGTQRQVGPSALAVTSGAADHEAVASTRPVVRGSCFRCVSNPQAGRRRRRPEPVFQRASRLRPGNRGSGGADGR